MNPGRKHLYWRKLLILHSFLEMMLHQIPTCLAICAIYDFIYKLSHFIQLTSCISLDDEESVQWGCAEDCMYGSRALGMFTGNHVAGKGENGGGKGLHRGVK